MIDASASLEAAGRLKRSDLVTYLTRTGWTMHRSRVQGICIFSKPPDASSEPIEFILPVIDGFSDEIRRIADALRTIGALEGRAINTIVSEIKQLVVGTSPAA
jgi:hypothetical protein